MAWRRLREVFIGKEAAPKSKYVVGGTPTVSEYYKGMNKWYREYRRDSLTRDCINALAFFSMCKGFETVLELTSPGKLSDEQIAKELENYSKVKEKADKLNKDVNLDNVLFIAVVKAKIFGKSGFEIHPKFDEGWPERLIPLRSDQLKPDVNEDWTLKGFNYEGKQDLYSPREILYFLNLSLEADYEGLSDVEPIVNASKARHKILSEDLPEIAHTLWAPMSIHQLDCIGLSPEQKKKAIDDHIAQIKPGKSVATDQKISVQVVDLNPDIAKLVAALEYLDYEIIGNFKVPRFLLGREKQVNRATAEKEFEAFIDGPISDIQRYFRREIERQWYDPITRKVLGVKEEEALPVRVKHIWNPITTEDFYSQADAVSKLWGTHAMGPIGGKLDKVWDLMHWDPKELEEEKG